MRRTWSFSFACLASVITFAVAACGDDDGAGVRNLGTEASGSASGSGSASASAASGSGSASASAASGSASASASASAASGSGSASGSAASASGTGSGATVDSGAATASDDPLVQEAVAQYTAYVQDQVDQLLVDATVFTDAVRAGDVEAAQAAYAPSRQAWERIAPIAALVPDIDAAVDARVDDVAGEDDPAWTGWHKLEYLLWETGDISAAGPVADRLDADLATLQEAVADLEIPPVVVADGPAELIEEVSAGTITGEEDRSSHTDLWDVAANVEGSKQAYEFLRPAIETADAELVAEIDELFADVEAQLASYAEGDGYRSYETLTDDDRTALQATLAQLAEELGEVAGVLGLG